MNTKKSKAVASDWLKLLLELLLKSAVLLALLIILLIALQAIVYSLPTWAFAMLVIGIIGAFCVFIEC